MDDVKVFFITGLGSDARIFRHIRLPEGFEEKHLHYIKPKINESLSDYALRLSDELPTGEPYVLFGLSMGGMIATEITLNYSKTGKEQPLATILLSSIPSFKHLPRFLNFAKRLKLQKLVPVKLLKSASIVKRLFSSESIEDKKVLLSIIRESDPQFIKWAMTAILNWKNEAIPDKIIHIHGTSDRILPIKYTLPNYILPKAGHLMVMDRAQEINIILATVLQSLLINR